MTILRNIAIALVALIAVGWLGFLVRPRPLAPVELAPGLLDERIPLPDNLPTPVRRYYRALYGEDVPVIESAIVTGRARLRMNGLAFWARYRFTHRTGEGYRHYIEGTWFGIPILKVNEHYLDGRGRMELPFGVIENEPKIDQAANLALWAEAIWYPTAWLTDARVRWEPIDDAHARLIVPFGEETDALIFAFDPETRLLDTQEAMRYREVHEDKILWRNTALGWAPFGGTPMATPASVRWMDQKKPWAVFTVEDVIYNAKVDAYIRAFGP